MTLSIGPEPFEALSSQQLITALAAELDQRYGGEDEAYLLEMEAAEVTPPSGVFIVARRDGEPVGCAALRPFRSKPGYGEVKRMYVVPETRGDGLGRRLLSMLESLGPDLGFRILQLETGDAQPEAVSLYESAGWTRIASYGRYADSPSSICFAKELDTR